MRRHHSTRAVARASVLGTGLLVALALLLSACGGGNGSGEDDASGARTAPRAGGPTGTTPVPPARGSTGRTQPAPGTRTTPAPPDSRDVDPDAVRVVDAWATTLARGDVAGAARYFALPSVVANGGRPLQLRTRAQARAFNRSLPCGAELLEVRAAQQSFLIATFKLLQRPGGDCGSGVGSSALTAIHVTDGLIDHWLRVPDVPPAAAGTPS